MRYVAGKHFQVKMAVFKITSAFWDSSLLLSWQQFAMKTKPV